MADDTNNSQAPGSDEPGAGETGFSEAFAERSKDPSGEKQREAELAAGATPAAEGGDGSATADAPGAASKEAADEGSGTKAPAFDPYAGLTPEQKSHFEALDAERVKLQASERSQRGRVGALTKKLNSMTGTHKPPASEESGSQARSDEGGEGGATGDETAADIEARLKAVTDEYGDIVGPVAEVVQELRKEVATLKASATRHEIDQDAEALTKAYEALETAHPDYKEVAGDKAFHDWLGGQPKGVVALANSFDPAEVSLALRLYKTESGATSEAPTDEGKGDQGSTATGDKRERQMDALRQAPSRGAPASSGVPNDFKSAFHERSKQKATG